MCVKFQAQILVNYGGLRTVTKSGTKTEDLKGPGERQVPVTKTIGSPDPNKLPPKAVQRNHDFWDTVFNSVGEAISIINVADFTIAEVNNVFLEQYGLTREQAIGQTCHAVTHRESSPCNGPEHSCPLIATVATGQFSAVEHIHYTRTGKRIAFEVSAAPIKDEQGVIVQVVHMARDITERKMAQQQLIINDRLASIGMLASGIAHEVGNPLTAIIGYANTLPLMADLPNEVIDGLKVIQEESQRAAEILKNLLTFARPEQGEKAPVDVNESISRVLGLRAYYQKSNKINTYLSFSSGLPHVRGNRSQLEQVFYNIVANAEFAMVEAHNGGNLTIITEHEDNVVRAIFNDDGAGISENNLGRIFTPFFTTKEPGKGTGLGLSISHGIVTEHGGQMWAESSKGKGAAFIVELPISREK
jgi:PAS domain S-box-containing protein